VQGGNGGASQISEPRRNHAIITPARAGRLRNPPVPVMPWRAK
jgi:hypothetical protein